MADEPTGNLDHQTSLAMQDLMLETARQDQMALIVVTHDQELAKRCDTTYQHTRRRSYLKFINTFINHLKLTIKNLLFSIKI